MKKKGKQKNLWPPVFAVLLTGYAVFTLLDAFVLPRDLVVMDTVRGSETSEADQESLSREETGLEDPIITETSYQSEDISIHIETIERHGTQVYVADVQLAAPSGLRTALAGGSFGRNIGETTSAMAGENDAILAINGDYYGFRDRGFVMREGYLYRDTVQGNGYEDLVIYEDGRLEVVEEDESDASFLAESGAVQIFSFGPGLIRNSEITVTEESEVEQSMQSNPRTAIGQIGDLHYLLVVSDGRTEESAGLTLLELAQVMEEYGCQTAYNLDGGGSSTMWFMGNVINNPTNGWRDGERSISDIVYIGE